MKLSYVYLRKSLTECTGDLVVDGSGHLCDVVSGYGVHSVGTHNDYFVSNVYFRNVCNVYHALVHADVSRDRANDSVYDNLAVLGIRTGISVSISESESSDLGRTLGDEFAAVTYGEAYSYFLKVNDVGLNGHDRLEIELVPVYFV